MSDWPLEVRIFAVCASLAAIVLVLIHGLWIAALAGVIYVFIVALVG